MNRKLLFTTRAQQNLADLENDQGLAKRLRAVRKALGLLQVNLKHPGLNTHKYDSLAGPNGEDVFEAYAENQTASAYRIFWFYGPAKDELTILAITPHP